MGEVPTGLRNRAWSHSLLRPGPGTHARFITAHRGRCCGRAPGTRVHIRGPHASFNERAILPDRSTQGTLRTTPFTRGAAASAPICTAPDLRWFGGSCGRSTVRCVTAHRGRCCGHAPGTRVHIRGPHSVFNERAILPDRSSPGNLADHSVHAGGSGLRPDLYRA